MIIVKLQGGLGNQMFQYAFTRGVAAKTGQEFCFDLRGFNTSGNITKRDYSLGVFGIDGPFFKHRGYSVVNALSKLTGKPGLHIVKEQSFSFTDSVWNIDSHRDTYFDGYWQSEKYFKHIEADIRKAFTLKESLSPEATAALKSITASTGISLQVRRGDYVSNKKVAKLLGACTPEYYNKGLALVMERSTKKPTHVFFFSDDIPWAKEAIEMPAGLTPVYVSNNVIPAHEEIVLMSMCNHHVISNSSFGWWGAWLDPRPDAVVVAPTPWFVDPRLENKDIAPPSWIRI